REFLGYGLGSSEVRIHDARQLHSLAGSLKLMIDTRVIAPKCSDSDDRYANILFQCLCSRNVLLLRVGFSLVIPRSEPGPQQTRFWFVGWEKRRGIPTLTKVCFLTAIAVLAERERLSPHFRK